MPFKVTFGFSQPVGPRVAGWSISLYAAVSTPAGFDSPALGGSHLQFMRDRLWWFCGRETIATFTRIQSLDPPFLSSIQAHNHVINAFTHNVSTDNPLVLSSDYPQTSALMRLTGASGAQSRIHIRGVVDEVVGFGGALVPGGTTAWTARVNATRTYLTAGEGAAIWRIRSRAATVETPITNITADGVVTAPGHAFSNGHVIRIKRVEGLRHANGQWVVEGVDGQTFRLRGWNPRVNDGPYKPSGRAYRVQYDLTPIVALNMAQVSSRRVGRPFLRFTGHQSPRRK